MLKFAFKDVSTKNSEPTMESYTFRYWLKNINKNQYTKTTISGIDLHWNYQKHISINKYQTIVVSTEYCLIQVPNCPVPSTEMSKSSENHCIVTVCVFVCHLFSFYPFYFDFHSARIIFDMSSDFYLWNVNRTTTWHL
jgi:hypothetical protein